MHVSSNLTVLCMWVGAWCAVNEMWVFRTYYNISMYIYTWVFQAFCFVDFVVFDAVDFPLDPLFAHNKPFHKKSVGF